MHTASYHRPSYVYCVYVLVYWCISVLVYVILTIVPQLHRLPQHTAGGCGRRGGHRCCGVTPVGHLRGVCIICIGVVSVIS
jgi:hypothetical protein